MTKSIEAIICIIRKKGRKYELYNNKSFDDRFLVCFIALTEF